MEKKEQSPTVFQFAQMDPATRDAFHRYCDVEEAKARAAQSEQDTKQRQMDHDARNGEPQRIIALAQAEAEAAKIRDAQCIATSMAMRDCTTLDMESKRIEGETMLGLLATAADLIWPKAEAVGRGFLALAREESALVREELRLIAGRNPIDGTK